VLVLAAVGLELVSAVRAIALRTWFVLARANLLARLVWRDAANQIAVRIAFATLPVASMTELGR
jgi:hypothetical protein